MRTPLWLAVRLASLVPTFGLLACTSSTDADLPGGTSGGPTDATSESSTGAEETAPGSESSSGVADPSGSSTGLDTTGESLPDPYDAPEGCFLQDDCTHDCDDGQLPYWWACGGERLCTVGVDLDPADIQCAIEALRDGEPGSIHVQLERPEKDWEDGFTATTLYFRVASSGLVARGLEVESYDSEFGSSYDTTLEPLARAHSADHPVWDACLTPEPDINCLLESAGLFGEVCIDEAFEVCED